MHIDAQGFAGVPRTPAGQPSAGPVSPVYRYHCDGKLILSDAHGESVQVMTPFTG